MGNCFYSIPTITCFTIYFVVKMCYPFVTTTDYIFYITHATVTNFDIITIEYLVILVISTKMFI